MKTQGKIDIVKAVRSASRKQFANANTRQRVVRDKTKYTRKGVKSKLKYIY